MTLGTQIETIARRFVDHEQPDLEIRCAACGWGLVCGAKETAAWLRRRGLLRENSEATPDELEEILRGVAPRQACPQCQAVGLQVLTVNDDVDWPEARLCEACRQPIAPERLEVFPNATRCTACERAEESGAPPQLDEYCPRCGSRMVVRAARSPGLARYELVCSAGSRCRG